MFVVMNILNNLTLMERIIKRIDIEASHNAYTLYSTYIEFIEKKKLLGGISYYANLVIRGAKCLVFHFNSNKHEKDEYMQEVVSYCHNLFAILDSKIADFSVFSQDEKKRFYEWSYSDTFEKMYYWFNRGWLLKFSENKSGFNLLSNYGQFILNLDRQRCTFEIKDAHPAQENNCIIQLKEEEGKFFLIAIKILVICELLQHYEYCASKHKVLENNIGCINMAIKEYFLEDRITRGYSRILKSVGIDIYL